MAEVQYLTVDADGAGMRLDRWLRARLPGLSQGRIEKLLRTGQVRVDGGRARANFRLVEGQGVRVPPQEIAPQAKARATLRHPMDPSAVRDLQARVLHLDNDILVLDKPRGLAVQGGTKTTRHLDAMSDALRFGAADAPRLVHRLDKETSGVLVMARNLRAARALASAFRGREVTKEYWALVRGVPEPREGRIETPIGRGAEGRKSTMPGPDTRAQKACSHYRVVENAAEMAAWLALWPHTGRTHQLRLHCEALGTPIHGDFQHAGARTGAEPEGQRALLPITALSRSLHLHARRIVLPHPGGLGPLRIDAPLPEDMAVSWRYFGFDINAYVGPAP